MNIILPENISIKTGYIKIQPEYIKEWKNKIRIQRQIDINNFPQISSVYRRDAKSLLAIATLLNSNTTIDFAQLKLRNLDSIVRELVPNELWDMVFKIN
jgi:hypothetical protein